MKDNVIKRKSYAFAVRIVELTRELRARRVEASMVNQLLRCGTSVSANVEEALAAISKREFSAKLSISYKEIRETKFWLKLLHESQSVTEDEFSSTLAECEEIARILFAILRTTRMSNERNEQ